MKHIKQLQSILLNKEDEAFSGKFDGVKNVWWIFYEGEKDISKNNFKLDIKWNVITVAIVYQYENGRMECEISKCDFQNEYSEEALKEIIIQDIKDEFLNDLFPDYLISDINLINMMWKYLSNDFKTIIKNVICIKYGNDAEKLFNNDTIVDVVKELEKRIFTIDELYGKIIETSNYYKKCIEDIKKLDNDLLNLNKTDNKNNK